MRLKTYIMIPMSVLLLCQIGMGQASPICPKIISVGFYEFGLLYHDGKGIDRAVIDELAKRSQCTLVGETLQRAQIWQGLSSGDIMLSVSAIKTPDRSNFSWFSEPYLILKNMAVLPKAIADTTPTAQAFLNNTQLRWGVVQSYRHGEQQDAFIAQLRAQNRVDEAQDSQQLFEWLHSNKVQGIFAQSTAYNFYYRQLNFQTLPVARDWAPNDRGIEARLVFSKKHFSEAQAAEWNKLLHTMRTDGTLKQILQQNLPDFEVHRVLGTKPDR